MKILTIIFILICALTAFSQTKATVTKASGGTIQTSLSYGIVLNKNSSLSREWITIHDNALPISFSDTIGIKSVYQSSDRSGGYRYQSSFSLEAKEPISAFEVRFLLFDLWGKHIKTLSFTEISDFENSKLFVGEWRAYNENEVSEYYASIAYIARVRTQSGKILEGNASTVLEEARKFSKKFTEDALNPTSDKK